MTSRWQDRTARGLSDLDLLVHRSRLIGAERALVVHGGGNTSVKTTEPDHRGRPTRVLRIKGSGADLASATAKDFPALRLDDLLPLFGRTDMDDADMVAYQDRCALAPGGPRPSIETLLHAFVPAPHVDHTHADAILALVNHPASRAIVRRALGDRIGFVPYVRPGFRLARLAGAVARANPGLEAIVFDRHGLLTWGATAKESYLRTIRYVTRAEAFLRRTNRGRAPLGGPLGRPLSRAARGTLAAALLPRLRGILTGGRGIVLLDDSPVALAWVDSRGLNAVAARGPATPDHVLHLKPWPAISAPVTGDPSRDATILNRAVAAWAARYARYFKTHAPAGQTMDPAVPRFLLVPRLGVIVTGKDRRAAGIALDLVTRNRVVQSLAFPLGAYTPIPERDLCEFEYWPNERYKLSLRAPDREFAGRVALVTGAASGIGLACARALVREGAHVVLADRDGVGAEREARALAATSGGRAIATTMDVTDHAAVRRGLDAAIRAFGGLDLLVSNAGIAKAGPLDTLDPRDWDTAMAVNATGGFLVAREAVRVMKAQGTGGAIAVIGTKNVPAPGAEFGAYSASKAAGTQLAKVLALEGGPFGIRVNIVNPDAIFAGSKLWSKEVLTGRARAHHTTVGQLPAFYAARTLLRRTVTGDDVAQAVLFLLSERAAKTTGAQLPVDGGVAAAFPR